MESILFGEQKKPLNDDIGQLTYVYDSVLHIINGQKKRYNGYGSFATFFYGLVDNINNW